MSVCRELAEKLKAELLERGQCARAELAGSLRRGEVYSHDVDIVCADPKMPMERQRIEKSTINKCKIEVYSAHPIHFGAMLFMYTGPSGYVIGYRKRAKGMNMLLNQYALWKNNKPIAQETEEEIYEALGKSWKSPEQRGK